MRESANPPALTVVIPARDAARALPRTLTALAGADVVVVDNGSRDATAEVARAHGARVISEPRRSRALARNAGAAAVTAPLLAFLDADCVPATGWTDAIAACLERADLVGGPIAWATSPAPGRVERFDAQWRLRPAETIARAGWTGSGNLGIRRELFEALGGFDASFPQAGEDVDLCFRAAARGARLSYCAEALATHPAERTVRGLLARSVRQGYAAAQLARRHPERPGRRYWRHPRPLVAGDWALRGMGIDPAADGRGLLAVARLDYAGRVAGSLWAELRRAR